MIGPWIILLLSVVSVQSISSPQCLPCSSDCISVQDPTTVLTGRWHLSPGQEEAGAKGTCGDGGCEFVNADDINEYQCICFLKDKSKKGKVQHEICQTLELKGGNGYSTGNVFTTNKLGVFGRVCYHEWDNIDAGVVCRQLGYHAGEATYENYFGNSSEPFALNYVRCNGSETDIAACTYSNLTDDCNLQASAGVICHYNITPSCTGGDNCCTELNQCGLGGGDCDKDSECAGNLVCGQDNCDKDRFPFNDSDDCCINPVELRGGNGYNYGNVFTTYNGVFGPVCDWDWDDNAAGVVCRQLGFTGGDATYWSYFGNVTEPFAMDFVECDGSETDIASCSLSWFGECPITEGAGVICDTTPSCTGGDNCCTELNPCGLGGGDCSRDSDCAGNLVCGQDSCDKDRFPFSDSDDCCTNPVELKGGDGFSYGNVYTFNKVGVFGPVCDDSWNNDAAGVVCRQLGFPGGEATWYSTFGIVTELFAMDSVDCDGSETHLEACTYSVNEFCGEAEGAGVICDPVSGARNKTKDAKKMSKANITNQSSPLEDKDKKAPKNAASSVPELKKRLLKKKNPREE